MREAVQMSKFMELPGCDSDQWFKGMAKVGSAVAAGQIKIGSAFDIPDSGTLAARE